MKRMLLFVGVLFGLTGILLGCTDVDEVLYNIIENADNFKVQRKVTFINTITNEVLYTVEGNFSIKADSKDNQLEITAKTGEDKFQKHFLGLSPTTVYIVEQLEWQEANKYQFKITIKPSTVVPEINIR